MKIRTIAVTIGLFGALALGGCATPLGQQYGTAGAIGGAIIGGATHGLGGAAVGGAIGALGGGAIGDSVSRQNGDPGYYPPQRREYREPCHWAPTYWRDGYGDVHRGRDVWVCR